MPITSDIRKAAHALRNQQPDKVLSLRQAMVVSVQGTNATIRLGGSANAADNIPGVKSLGWYAPVANDTVWVAHQGADYIIIGKLDGTGSVARSGDTMTGPLIIDRTGLAGNDQHIKSANPQILFEDTDRTGAGKRYWFHHNNGLFYILQDRSDNGTWDGPHPFQIDANGNVGFGFAPAHASHAVRLQELNARVQILGGNAFAATDSGDLYPTGISTFHISDTASGWPYAYGVVTSVRHNPNRMTQTLTAHAFPTMWARVWYGGAWSAWRTINDDSGWLTPTFLNSFTDYGGVYACRYRKLNGVVYIKGIVNHPGSTSTLTAFVLPAGYRPAVSGHLIATMTNAGVKRLDVRKEGDVQITAPTNSWNSVDCSFPADA